MRTVITTEGMLRLEPENGTESFALAAYLQMTPPDRLLRDALDLSKLQAELGAFQKVLNSQVPAQDPEEVKCEAPAPRAKEEAPASEEPDRDQVKAELKAMGVAYNNKCATKTLVKLLEEEKAKAAEVLAKAEEVVQPSTQTAAPNCVACGDTGKNSQGGPCVCQHQAAPAPAPQVSPSGMITLDMVMEQAKRLAAHIGGQDGIKKVEEIVAQFGVTKISEVPADRYQDLVQLLGAAIPNPLS